MIEDEDYEDEPKEQGLDVWECACDAWAMERIRDNPESISHLVPDAGIRSELKAYADHILKELDEVWCGVMRLLVAGRKGLFYYCIDGDYYLHVLLEGDGAATVENSSWAYAAELPVPLGDPAELPGGDWGWRAHYVYTIMSQLQEDETTGFEFWDSDEGYAFCRRYEERVNRMALERLDEKQPEEPERVALLDDNPY